MYNVLHGASLSGVPLLCRCLGHPKKGDFDEWRGAQGGVTLSHCSWLDDLELRSLQMMKRCLKSQPLKTQKARLFLGAVAEKTQKARLCLGVEERSRCLYLIHWYHFNPFYTHPIPTPTFSGYQLRPCRRWKSPARSKFMSKGLIWVFFFPGGTGSYTKIKTWDTHDHGWLTWLAGLKNLPRFMVAPTTEVFRVLDLESAFKMRQ